MTNNFDVNIARYLDKFLSSSPARDAWSRVVDVNPRAILENLNIGFNKGQSKSNAPKIDTNSVKVKPEPSSIFSKRPFAEGLKEAKKVGEKILKKPTGGGIAAKAVPVVGTPIGVANMMNKDNSLWDRGVGAAQALSGAASFVPVPIVKGAGMVGSYVTPFLYSVDDWLGFSKPKTGSVGANVNIQNIPATAPVPTPSKQTEGLEMLPDLDALGESDLIAKAITTSPIRSNSKQPILPSLPIGVQPAVAGTMAPVPTSQASKQIEDIGNAVGNTINTRSTMDNGYDTSALLGLLDRYLAAGAPVNEAMVDAIQRYPGRLADTQRQQRFWRGIANWSGDSGYNQLANELTPLEQANQQLALRQNLMNQSRSDIQAVGNLLAGMDMANYVGMPPSVAMMGADATKEISKMPVAYMNLLGRQYAADQNLAGRMYASDRTAETGRYAADRGLEGRQYVSDNSYNASVYNATLDSLTQQYLMQGKYDLAMQLQQLKNTGDINRALVQQLPWTTNYNTLFDVYSRLTGSNVLSPATGLGTDGLPLTTQQNKQVREFLTKLQSRR